MSKTLDLGLFFGKGQKGYALLQPVCDLSLKRDGASGPTGENSTILFNNPHF